MSHDLLSQIAGLSSENLVSETLAYILNDKAYAPFQRLFYEYLFDNNRFPTTLDANLSVETQLDFVYGRPDILIRGPGCVVLIENKFYAPFSRADQLSHYYQLLRDDEELSKLKDRFLVLLTPSSRKSYYEKLAVEDFARSTFPGVADVGSLSAETRGAGIGFRVIEWEEIMKRFESDDVLVSSLIRYIEKYVGEVKFMADELHALQSKVYAEALDKLFKSLDNLRGRIDSDTLDTSKYRMSTSRDYYAFAIVQKHLYAYFGYIRPRWLKPPYTPLHLQVRLSWVTDNSVNKDKLAQSLSTQHGFTLDPEWGYVKAYDVDSLSNLDGFAETLRKDLQDLDDACVASVSLDQAP